jgi:hypothetical protein
VDASVATQATAIQLNGSSFADTERLSLDFARGGSEGVRLSLEPDQAQTNGDFIIETGGFGSTSDRLRIEGNGDISFYEDTGTTAKFFWDASAESLGIGTSSPQDTGAGYSNLTINGTTGAVIDLTDDDVRVGSFFNTANDVSLGNFTATGFLGFRTNSTERMRIDSSGNVGIGTSSPTGKLHLQGSTGGYLELKMEPSADTDVSSISFRNAADNQTKGYVLYDHTSNYMGFRTNGSGEAMRIDSSGNLLVSTTGNTPATGTNTGIALKSNDTIEVGTSGAAPLLLNRTSNDGNIATFRKNGTTVGSIGVTNSGADIVIESTRYTNWSGLRFTNSAIRPRKSGADSDAGVDLGLSSSRFKDLYLSGGVYLGGTGAANKLDDYEEGTWTPTYADASNNTITTVVDGGYATYTKVGRMVTVHARINTSGLTSLSGFSGELRIAGLPFTSGSTRRTAFGTFVSSRNFSSYGSLKAVPWNISVFNGANYIRLHKYVSSGTESAYTYPELDVTDLTLLGGNRNRLEFSITYETS